MQKNGIILPIPYDGNGERLYRCFPILQFIISDCKGADYLTGRFGSHSKNVRGLVRDCNIPTRLGDRYNHVCQYFSKLSMQRSRDVEGALINLSYHRIHNSFHKISFGFCNKYGIYGSTPPESLHMYWLGICDYLYDGFVSKLSQEMQRFLERKTKEIVFMSSRQSQCDHIKLPYIATFGKEFQFVESS